MRKYKSIFIIVLFLISNKVICQDFSDSWAGHFSYLNIVDISEGENKIYAASDNTIFSYDLIANEINEITTINGLSGEFISTIHYDEVFELVIIGYENGLMEIYFEDGRDVLTIIDIRDKPTIPADKKIINHFNLNDNLVYISTNYGISVYDLENLEFGDTYFIGDNGTQIRVNQTTILGDYIYAACYDLGGVRKALVASPNLINFQEWDKIRGGNWRFIQNVDGNLYAVRSSRKLFTIDQSDVFTEIFVYDALPSDMVNSNNYLLITTSDNVFVYDSLFNEIATVNQHPDFITEYSCAVLFPSNDLFIGSENIFMNNQTSLGANQGKKIKSGFGVLKTNLNELELFEEIHPNGPLLNTPFSIEGQNGNLWCVYGGYSVTYSFNAGTAGTGISKYVNQEWFNKPYDSILSTVNDAFYLSHIAIDPFNTEQAYVSSYFSGLLEFENFEFTNIYNRNNSTIVPFAAELHLTLASGFDSQGALWVTNGRVEKALNRFKDGQWTSFDLTEIITSPSSNLGFSDIDFDQSGNVFFGSYSRGLMGFNENGGELNNLSGEEDNMPTDFVTAVAVDNRNQVWIGTFKGLRVLYNTSNFYEDDNSLPQEIIILEDGVPKELLFQTFISDIEVDGSNNKWISTIGSGLFYFSSDGQETIFHFTKDNSPLPTNNIVDVAVDNSNGIVYIATDRGLLSFKAGGSSPTDTLENAFIYPNPVRPAFNIVDEKVKIKDISDNVNIKITDIEGNLVAEAQSRNNLRYRGYNLEIDGGTAFWNGKNLANNVVKSGVYLVMLSDLDTLETKVLKIMVVR